jgi:hypothetical protein
MPLLHLFNVTTHRFELRMQCYMFVEAKLVKDDQRNLFSEWIGYSMI